MIQKGEGLGNLHPRKVLSRGVDFCVLSHGEFSGPPRRMLSSLPRGSGMPEDFQCQTFGYFCF